MYIQCHRILQVPRVGDLEEHTGNLIYYNFVRYRTCFQSVISLPSPTPQKKNFWKYLCVTTYCLPKCMINAIN